MQFFSKFGRENFQCRGKGVAVAAAAAVKLGLEIVLSILDQKAIHFLLLLLPWIRFFLLYLPPFFRMP